MKKTIVTERLALAAICSEDREKLIRLLCDSEVGKTYMVPDLRTEDQKNRLFDHLFAISKSEQRFLYGIYH